VQFDTAGGTILGALRCHSDGLFDVSAATTRQDSSNFSWTDGSWHRIDWQCDAAGASIVVTARLYAPGVVEGSTPTDTIVGTMNSGTLGRWQFGCLGGNAGTTIKADTVRLADGLEWIGPFATHATPTPGSVARAVVVPAPALQLGATSSPASVARAALVPAPAVSGGAATSPAAVARAVATPAPVVLAGATATPSGTATVTAVPAPLLRCSTTVTPAQTAGVAAVPVPAQGPSGRTGGRLRPAGGAASRFLPEMQGGTRRRRL
jgi:hypothetical protein